MKYIFLFLALIFTSVSYAQQSYNIIAFGAHGDNNTLNTLAIQTAIDKCFNGGGGTVIIPPEVFLTGTIYSKSNVTLFLESGSILRRSTEKEIYKNKALIYSERQDNIAIFGNVSI